MLAIALATVILALALPFKVFLSQRHAIAKLEEQTRAQQRRVAALQAQQQRWQDPAYIAAQARERLHFVMPGETSYVVLGGPRSAPDAPAAQEPAQTLQQPWYSQLWHTVQVAGKQRHPTAR